eukprot:861359-Alexandrium_andersonii.AAC.1
MASGDQYTEYFTELASEAVQGAGCCLVGVGLVGWGAVLGQLLSGLALTALHAGRGFGCALGRGGLRAGGLV